MTHQDCMYASVLSTPRLCWS